MHAKLRITYLLHSETLKKVKYIQKKISDIIQSKYTYPTLTLLQGYTKEKPPQLPEMWL